MNVMSVAGADGGMKTRAPNSSAGDKVISPLGGPHNSTVRAPGVGACRRIPVYPISDYLKKVGGFIQLSDARAGG